MVGGNKITGKALRKFANMEGPLLKAVFAADRLLSTAGNIVFEVKQLYPGERVDN